MSIMNEALKAAAAECDMYREALERIVGHIDNGPTDSAWIKAIAQGALDRGTSNG